MVIDLFPSVRASRAHLIENAVIAVEELGASGSFDINDVVDATYREPQQFGAVRQTLRTLEGAGLIRRVSAPRSIPIRYRLNHDLHESQYERCAKEPTT